MSDTIKPKVIALDGPAGAGKSTVAKRLAQKLKFSYLDTGAMYRALTYKALKAKINLESEEQLVALARMTDIDIQDDDGNVKVLLDGKDVSQNIRTQEVTDNTFYAARAGKVREIMVEWQQEIGKSKNIVVEGRDIGTVVFPGTPYKFYLDADLEIRAQRRAKDFTDSGETFTLEQLMQAMRERDQKDFTRAIGPLRKASDAITIDSSDMSIDDTVDTIIRFIKGS